MHELQKTVRKLAFNNWEFCMHGKPDGRKARKSSGTEVLNEQSILSNQSEPGDGIVWRKKPHKIIVTDILRWDGISA